MITTRPLACPPPGRPRPPRTGRTLFTAGAVLLLAAFTEASAAPAAGAPRWNILFFFADDWGRHASAYAKIDGRPTVNDVLDTPHLDRIAREGVLFRHAFVNSPSCTPCRSSLFSGRYFFNTGRGAILSGAVWDDSIPSFPLLLRDAGYHIGKTYKAWSPGTPVDAPFGEQKYAYESAGRAANQFSQNVTARMAGGASLADARSAILAEVRGNFDAFLAARSAGRPWLYYFGVTNTHRKWTKGSGKALWGIDPDRLKGRMPAFLPDVHEVREDVADYLGEVQALDAFLGVLMEQLAATGELERTLVVLSGDHGMPGVPSGKTNLYDHGVAVALMARVPGGTAGRVIEDFVSLPDLAPTFLEVAGVPLPPRLDGRSILPILRSPQSGQIEAERTWVITGRERHVFNAREGGLPYPMRSLRTREFAYVRNFAPDRWPMGEAKGALAPDAVTGGALEMQTHVGFADMDASPTKSWLVAHRNDPKWKWYFEHAFGKRPAEELYDLRQDPDQVRNVAADPAYAAVRRQLAEQLLHTLTEAGDPRVTGDGGTFDRPPFADVEPPPRRKGGKRNAK